MENNLDSNKLFNQSNHVSILPKMVFVELTRSCNMYCTCCRPSILANKELDMTDSILQKVEDELLENTSVIDFRGWGESTLDKRLPELIQKWSSKGKTIILYTNCQAQNDEYWNNLFRLDVNVAISLRSANKERYENFMRGASFEQLKANLSQIPKNNKVVLTVVVGDDNITDLSEIVNLANAYDIKTIHLNPLSHRPNPEDYPILGVTKNNKELLLRELDSINTISKEMNIDIRVCADLLSEDSYDLKRCIHPWSYVYVSYNGNIGFCDHLMCVEESIMGNINSEHFSKIWNNEKYLQLRNRHAQKEVKCLFEDNIECNWCYKNRYANWETLVNSDYVNYSIDDYLKMKNYTIER